MTWSRALGVPTLGAIQTRLDEPFDAPLRFDFGPTAPARRGPVDTVARNCTELLRMYAAGYTVGPNVEWVGLRGVGSGCAALRRLAAARPAARSAVRGVELTPTALDVLPPVLGLIASRDDSARVWNAARRGASWRATVAGLTASPARTYEGEPALDVQGPSDRTRVQILARGDFNGDGLDDVLVESNAGATGGSLRTVHVFLLTREREGEVLRVVEEVW